MDTTETSLDERIWDENFPDAFPVATVAANLGLCELRTLGALSVSECTDTLLCPKVDDLGVLVNIM